jgi:hypothetical protein
MKGERLVDHPDIPDVPMNVEYNGWSNRATWAAVLWLSNEEPLYRAVCAGVDPLWLLAHHEGFLADLGEASMLDIDMDQFREAMEELQA